MNNITTQCLYVNSCVNINVIEEHIMTVNAKSLLQQNYTVDIPMNQC